MQTKKLLQALLLCIFTGSMFAACSPAVPPTPTASASEPIPGTTAQADASLTPETTLTTSASPVNKVTPDINSTAVAQANAMQLDMQNLAAFKLVSSATGSYYRVQDFTGEWAKLSYYHWWPLNRKPTNFAIRADITWDSAMPNANPSKAGCGFVFHENGADNLHFSYLSMDGYVRNYRMDKKIFSDLKANWAGKFNYPSDSAKFMLVVDYQWITVFVNDKQIVRFQDDRLKGGGLAYAVSSGSNNDFGTRCTFENVELWEFN
jgi:hypothetical protein